jgi:hypothetical protein
MLSTVSIIPGIENLAPERQETRSGSVAFPNRFPVRRSSSRRAATSSSQSPLGQLPERRKARQASVVRVKPGGTGSPSRVISARLAPFPPSRAFTWSQLRARRSTSGSWSKRYTKRASPAAGARTRGVRRGTVFTLRAAVVVMAPSFTASCSAAGNGQEPCRRLPRRACDRESLLTPGRLRSRSAPATDNAAVVRSIDLKATEVSSESFARSCGVTAGCRCPSRRLGGEPSHRAHAPLRALSRETSCRPTPRVRTIRLDSNRGFATFSPPPSGPALVARLHVGAKA